MRLFSVKNTKKNIQIKINKKIVMVNHQGEEERACKNIHEEDDAFENNFF